MKFIVIGLGSMGKRRIRCLQSLGHTNIIGVDPRKDRRDESSKNYGINTYALVDELILKDIDALIISTPPDLHLPYLKLSVEKNIPSFVEASVIIDEVKEIKTLNTNNTFIAPSCTFHFHPLIKRIREIIKSKTYGKITNFTYHSGQYLPDWHPWEDVKDFYVSKRETGGGREIVPFELTWITKSIGYPEDIKGYFKKTIDFGAEIEDTYAFVVKFENFLGSIIVDVASRFATRQLILNFEEAQLTWNWDDGFFRIYDAKTKEWIVFEQEKGANHEGYNKNIVESMYIEEIATFLKGIHKNNEFPNTISDDIKTLELLTKIEKSDGGF